MTTQRLFLALALPDSVRSLLAGMMDSTGGLRWTPVDQLHITLRFLGDVPADKVDPLVQQLAAVAVQSFILPVEGVGAFPPKAKPQVLWVGVGAGHPRLHQIRQRVDDTVLAAGIDLDVRAFHPHITMARCSDVTGTAARRWLRGHADFTGPSFAIDAFRLYESRLSSAGAVHTLVATFPLATAAVSPQAR